MLPDAGVQVTVGAGIPVVVVVKVTVAVQALAPVLCVMLAGQVIPSVAQTLTGEELLRGVGLPVAKSEGLLSVSVQPLAPRRMATVALGAGALPLSLQVVLVVP